MNPINDGLIFSLFGILIIFVLMVLFDLVMVGIQVLYPAKKEQAETDKAPVESIKRDAVAGNDEEIVAAIAVAITLLRSKYQHKLGERLEMGHGRWWGWDA